MKSIFTASALGIAFGAVLFGQDLRITASLMSSSDVSALFGPLKSQYGGARVDICYKGTDARSIPLAMVRQQLKVTNNIVVLSNVEALTVIAKAQASTKKAVALRIGVGVVQIASLASAWSGLSSTIKNTLNASAISGMEAVGVISGVATTTAMVSYSAVALPETLNFSSAQLCVPQAIQLIETIKGSSGNIDFSISLPVIQANTGDVK